MYASQAIFPLNDNRFSHVERFDSALLVDVGVDRHGNPAAGSAQPAPKGNGLRALIARLTGPSAGRAVVAR